jgi:hypothetical protein
MTWKNAFDLGECTVTLVDWTADGVTVWSGVLGKGESHAGTTDDGNAFTLAVDANGKVSLGFDDNVTGKSFEIQIVPSYAHDFPARISGMATDIHEVNVTHAYGEINADPEGDEGVDYLSWQFSGTRTEPPEFSPEPLDMTALTGTRDLIGVYLGTGLV